MSAYSCAFEHTEFVVVVDLPPQRQRVIREGNDHDPGLSARRDLAGRREAGPIRRRAYLPPPLVKSDAPFARD